MTHQLCREALQVGQQLLTLARRQRAVGGIPEGGVSVHRMLQLRVRALVFALVWYWQVWSCSLLGWAVRVTRLHLMLIGVPQSLAIYPPALQQPDFCLCLPGQRRAAQAVQRQRHKLGKGAVGALQGCRSMLVSAVGI